MKRIGVLSLPCWVKHWFYRLDHLNQPETMTKNNAFDINLLVSLMGGIVAGMAVYWFIRGDYADHSTLRALLVGGQFLVGVALAVHGWRKHSAVTASPGR